MIKSKLLSDSAWKDILSKNKGAKDNGLLKALAEIRKLGEDDHDDSLKALDEVLKLIGQLKKSKEVAASPAVGKYLAELAGAADSAAREIGKAKVEADKKAKAEADAKKREQEERKAGRGEDDDEEEASPTLLTTKMVPLLRLVNKGETMHAMVASTGKQVVVMLSRKPIPPARRKVLAEELGSAGGIKYFVGHCTREQGATTFVLKTQVAGLAKKIKLALLQQTGLRLTKLRCRGEDGETDDDEDEGAKPEGNEPGRDEMPEEPAAKAEPPTGMARPFEVSATVGRGGKNLEEDVMAVQAALNRRADAGLDVDGHCGPDTIQAIVDFQRAMGQSKPDGRVDPRRGTARALAASGKIGKPPPAPSPLAPPDLGVASLARAPEVWHGTRHILDHNIGELKRAIRQEYANEHPSLLAEIDQNVQRVDVVLEKLDLRLAQTLERAGAAKDKAKRKVEIDAAKAILADYIAFVKTEPLIDHIDNNPFGVDAKVRKVITDSLTHMVKSIA